MYEEHPQSEQPRTVGWVPPFVASSPSLGTSHLCGRRSGKWGIGRQQSLQNDFRKVLGMQAGVKMSSSSIGATSLKENQDDEGSRMRLADIRRQMEFWFSPANLRRDWYLRRRMDSDGWLDPSLFLNFNLMKRLNASVSDIIEACRRSSIFEVSTPNDTFGDAIAQTRIRRADGPLIPHLEESLDDETARSIVIEKLPTDSTCDSIRELFSAYGEVTYVWLPKKAGGVLRGYALVVYDSIKDARRALSSFAGDSERGSMPGGMTVQSKVEWEKSLGLKKLSSTVIIVKNITMGTSWRELWNAVQPRFAEASIQLLYLSFKHNNDYCYITVRNEEEGETVVNEVLNSMKVNGRVLEPSIVKETEALNKYWSEAADQIAHRKRQGKDGQKSNESSEADFPLSVIVKVEGLPKGLYWKNVMDELQNNGDVVFLRYNSRSGSCFVRFSSTLMASNSVERVDGSKLCGHQVKARVLEGEEEAAYWSEVSERKARSVRNREGWGSQSKEAQKSAVGVE